ncbi:hypothetical protein [Bacillus sp. CGMCC 1.16541]|uniref:hypothetical protein n=1 Tax=Bacillus sp. CGMCC 1.16541 TaxID=2185143 RepID=UPI000D733AFC|nr:hypothetical protein [Bacillus sp. CGMCC 1.16541]
MAYLLPLICIIVIMLSFFFYCLALMELAPMILAGPIMFLSIFITLLLLNRQNQFKGFKK